MNLTLPDGFVRNVTTAHDGGAAWLARLPALLGDYAERWELALGEPFELSYNYVCSAMRADGTEAVLKAGCPNPEGHSELAALRLWKSDGVVRVLEADPENYVFLMERLRPGTSLRSYYPQCDDDATRIAARTMRALWKPMAHEPPLIPLSEWTAELADLRPHFQGGTGPFPAALVDRALELFRDFPTGESVLIHGDLHHDNLLADGDGWRVIDPKGLVGDPGFEVGTWLYNFWDEPLDRALLARRVAIFAEELGFEKERVIGWGLAASVLSAWWSFDTRLPDGGSDWQFCVSVADALGQLTRC